MNGFISWDQYGGLQSMNGMMGDQSGGDLTAGFASLGDVEALNKALTAGADVNNPGSSPGEGFPLRVESLDQTLYNTTYTAKDVKFWKALYKDQAYNTIEEFNRLESYGSGDSIWMGEGDLPAEDDSTYSRQYTKIKFMGTTRRVSHVMSILRAAHGDAVAREQVNGTLFLLRQLERALFVGDENYIPIQFDGLETMMMKAFDPTLADDGQYLGYTDVNVIDCRGQPLSEDFIADLAERLVAEPNFGTPDNLWTCNGPVKDLSKILYPKERYDLPAPSNGMAGVSIRGIVTPFGDINFNPDVFVPDSVVPVAAGVGKAGSRPLAPTVGTPTSPAYSGTGYFSSADAGTYFYKIVAGSRWGKSTPATSASIAVSAGDEVTMTVTDNGPDTSYYEVSRSDVDGAATTCRTIFRVKRTGTSQAIRDLNRFLPNCSKGYMLSQTPQVIKWKQLAPFTKMMLGQLDTSIRWAQILYGAPQLMKPKHCGMFINIGKLATGVNA